MRDLKKLTPEIRRVRDEIRALEFETRLVLGKNVQEHRKKQNMNQEQLAKLLGRSRISILNIEAGNIEISMPMFLRICQVLKATPNQLLKEKKCSSEKQATSTLNSGSSTS